MKKLIKQILLSLSTILIIFTAISIISPITAYAEGFEGRSGNACPSVLGLTSWDCGVVIHDEETLKSGIWTIVANIATDLSVIATYLIIGYVIYGGYRYMFSGGDPSKVATGKKTLLQAFIGLAIVMSASVIMGAIRIALVGNGGDISECAESVCVDPNQMVDNLIYWVINIAGIVAVIFLIYGGITYITSSGDPSKIKKARDTILYACIGLIIVALANIITAFVSNIIREANADNATSTLIETTIAKEITS